MSTEENEASVNSISKDFYDAMVHTLAFMPKNPSKIFLSQLGFEPSNHEKIFGLLSESIATAQKVRNDTKKVEVEADVDSHKRQMEYMAALVNLQQQKEIQKVFRFSPPDILSNAEILEIFEQLIQAEKFTKKWYMNCSRDVKCNTESIKLDDVMCSITVTKSNKKYTYPLYLERKQKGNPHYDGGVFDFLYDLEGHEKYEQICDLVRTELSE